MNEPLRICALIRKQLGPSALGASPTYDLSTYNKESIAGYGETWGVVDDVQDRLLGKPLGCDGVFTSASDLIIFCRHWLKKIAFSEYSKFMYETSFGEKNDSWSFYESLGIGKKVFGWEQHDKKQSYIGQMCSDLTIEKAGGAGAFICIRPERQEFFIYLTNHGRPDPFTMEAWNQLVLKLRVREIAMQVMNL